MHEQVLGEWPDEIPAVLVSYDHPDERLCVAGQVEAARQLFRKHPKHLHLFLLKPETTKQTLLDVALRSAIASADELGSFDLIGVTEKELGRSTMDRMVQVARLRRALDEADVPAPIHVFGALDPLSVALYFLSGAEIFDGLTWLRYGYDNGRCVYPHNLGPLKYGIHERDDAVRARILADNYYQLQELQHRLREFEATRDESKLEPHSKLLADALVSLETRLRRK